jgi:LPS sulfotransferase NodH
MQGENILFIVGAPRSGTTWVQKILASHRLFITAQESEFFTSIALPVLNNYDQQLRYPSGRGGTGLPVYFRKSEIEHLLADMFYKMVSGVDGYVDKSLFIEKTPSHALTIDEINRVLPKSRFVHIVRNPVDVAASMMLASKTWGRVWAPKNILAASRMWRKHVTAAMQSFHHIEESRKITIRYEDLRVDPISVISQLVSHFSLPIHSSEIGGMISSSSEYKLKIYGEFGGVSGDYETEPKDFARKGGKFESRKRELLFIEKVFQQIYLRKEMKQHGY